MFKVKNTKTNEITTALSAYCDEYGGTWLLFWENDGWRWRPGDNYCPPNVTPKKKVIIAGSRGFNDWQLAYRMLNQYKDVIKEVICGDAKGADTIGAKWAEENGIRVNHFPADWQKYGAAAGYIRNKQMGDIADKLIAFWDGRSPGTKHMIEYMRELGKDIEVIKI